MKGWPYNWNRLRPLFGYPRPGKEWKASWIFYGDSVLFVWENIEFSDNKHNLCIEITAS